MTRSPPAGLIAPGRARRGSRLDLDLTHLLDPGEQYAFVYLTLPLATQAGSGETVFP